MEPTIDFLVNEISIIVKKMFESNYYKHSMECLAINMPFLIFFFPAMVEK